MSSGNGLSKRAYHVQKINRVIFGQNDLGDYEKDILGNRLDIQGKNAFEDLKKE